MPIIDTSGPTPEDYDVDCGTAKTVRLVQAVWDDLRVPLAAGRMGITKVPSFEQIFDNGAGSVGVFAWAFADQAIAGNEEELFFEAQIPHRYKLASDIATHIHWVPAANGGAGEFVKWGLEYTWANIDAVFGNTNIIYSDASSAATATTSSDGSMVAGKHYVTELGTISGAGKGLSSMLICRIFRNSSDATDDYTDDAFALEVDFHFQVDTLGSRQEYVK